MPDHASPPDDIAALKALLLQLDSEVQQLRSTVSTLEQALNVRALEIEQLKLQIAKLKRMHFGRKSERSTARSSNSKPASRPDRRGRLQRTGTAGCRHSGVC